MAFLALTLAFVISLVKTQVQAQTATGPTAASALSADEAINQAILTGNGDALKPLLADDWIVVSGFGEIADKTGFIDFIRMSGARKTMILSEPRVRLYGDTALVTTHLDAMGLSSRKLTESRSQVLRGQRASNGRTGLAQWRLAVRTLTRDHDPAGAQGQ